MDEELRTHRLVVMVTPSEIEFIDDWRFANRVNTRSEAVRRLLMIALQADPIPPEESRAAYGIKDIGEPEPSATTHPWRLTSEIVESFEQPGRDRTALLLGEWLHRQNVDRITLDEIAAGDWIGLDENDPRRPNLVRCIPDFMEQLGWRKATKLRGPGRRAAYTFIFE